MEDSFRYLSHIAVRTYSEEDQKYGLPELKKYPMPDAAHVRSAIKFFNYVDPRYERELASAILRRMKEYGLTPEDIGVGKDNRFSKYVPKDYLSHHGILGQKWGVRRYQNKDGSLTSAGKERYKEHANNVRQKEAEFVRAGNQLRKFMKDWPEDMDRPAILVMNHLVDGKEYSVKEQKYLDKQEKLANNKLNKGREFMNSLIEIHGLYSDKIISELSPDLIEMGYNLAMADRSYYHGSFHEWTSSPKAVSFNSYEEYKKAEDMYKRQGSRYT